uniref:NADH dehydrogenase subunit 4L n=1 Tax=Amphiascoides atopus TaxID=1352461 RepID=W8DND4_9MAXI|nr:NADH dehydrogenase subunit 4L [Amphiascoides atopus]AHB52763.1 NADH dehydrogenase subunit 4L [Amphiascoides atopus]
MFTTLIMTGLFSFYFSVSPWTSLLSFPLIFIVSVKFFYHSKNLLMLLLSLEMGSVMILLSILTLMSTSLLSPSLILLFLVLIVCEASLGLSLLVRLGRISGNELLLD